MSAKRKLVYNGHHGIEGEAANCLWCGQSTTEHVYVVNPGGRPVLKCCCEEHYRLTEHFVEQDSKYRPLFYILIGLCAIASWVAVGFLEQQPAWTSIPFVAICSLLVAWPRVLPRYEYYLPHGLERAQRIVRTIASGLLLYSLIVTAAHFGIL